MSSTIRTLALSAVAAVAVAQGTTSPKLDAPCADAVIFMARGNNAPYQDSRTFPFVEATCGKLRAEGKTCDFIEVVFETMMNGDFCTQIAEGVRNGQSQITAFNKKCPCTHLILNGFSQGAWITGDILGGPGGCSQITTGLDNTSAPGNAIAAALLWGDVMHVANQPYNVLDGAGLQKDGRSADSLARLNRYAPVLRSYCAKGDPICANGNDVDKHLSYFELYTDDASTWAVGKLNDAAPLCAAPTPTPSASSNVVASSVGVASATAVASSSAAASSSVAALSAYPTSPVHVAPFPVPQPYEAQCVPRMKIEYVYV